MITCCSVVSSDKKNSSFRKNYNKVRDNENLSTNCVECTSHGPMSSFVNNNSNIVEVQNVSEWS